MLTTYLRTLQAASRKVSARSGRPRPLVVADMLYCTLAYGASPNNYAWYHFENLTSEQRRSYVTHGDSERLIRKYNDPAARERFENKVWFARTFEKYFGRQWLDVHNADSNDFMEFLSGKQEIIAKPLDEAQGRGIEKIRINEFASADTVIDYLKVGGRFGIIEEYITQHGVLSDVYSGAVAVIRVVTIVVDDRTDLISAAVTFGNGDTVSNFWRGGLMCPIDISTGEIPCPAVDKNGMAHEHHPATGHRFQGFVIPHWDDIVSMVVDASRVVPSVKYVGWDIAVTPSGPILIEGNTSPGYSALQHPVFRPDRYGLRPVVARYLNS